MVIRFKIYQLLISLVLFYGVMHNSAVAQEKSTLNAYYQDKKNGVFWRRCDIGTRLDEAGVHCVGTKVQATWVEAVALINSLNAQKFEGREDWRLPSGEELKSLLLDNDAIRIGPYPVIRGPASAFGGYHLTFAEGKCRAANETIYNIFSSVNALDGAFFESHRWMADNSDRKTWQNPLTINLVSDFGMFRHGFCNVLMYAFLEDQFDSKRQGEMRPHAQLPIILVGGGNESVHWKKAQLSINSSGLILEESKRRGQADLATLNAGFERVGNFVREVMSAANRPNPSPDSSGVGRTWVCQVQCRGPLFKLGSRPRVPSVGSTQWEAAENAKSIANKICLPEPGISWGEVVRCE